MNRKFGGKKEEKKKRKRKITYRFTGN